MDVHNNITMSNESQSNTKSTQSVGSENNFINNLQSMQHTLERLERSFRKSNEYETKLLQCKKSHSVTFDDKCWDLDITKSNTTNSATNKSASNSKTFATRVDVDTESWSTMSIVCLQYKYEELAKRYEALLQAYDGMSKEVALRDSKLHQWRQRAAKTHAQIAYAHEMLLTVGEKYMALKKKRNMERNQYKEEMSRMQETLREVVATAEEAQQQFNSQLGYYLSKETDPNAALLLNEIRKCNLLFLENIRLKGSLQESVSEHAKCHREPCDT